MTWRAGPGNELTWHARPARGCDVALRPRGRAMTGPREAQVALTRGRRPSRRVHIDACEGRHVACGGEVCIWRAHGCSGALVREGGGNAITSQLRPPYLTAFFSTIFSVWDYVPTRFYDAGDVAVSHSSDSS